MSLQSVKNNINHYVETIKGNTTISGFRLNDILNQITGLISEVVGDYLPLSGGIMTGPVNIEATELTLHQVNKVRVFSSIGRAVDIVEEFDGTWVKIFGGSIRVYNGSTDLASTVNLFDVDSNSNSITNYKHSVAATSVLDFDQTTTNQLWTLPDSSGTIALTSDLPSGFTGTGAYTNFTIVDGIITVAS